MSDGNHPGNVALLRGAVGMLYRVVTMPLDMRLADTLV